MKKIGAVLLSGMFLAFALAAVSQAQEETKAEAKKESKMVIKVVKDGKTVMDTTMEVTGNFDQEMVDKMISEYAGDDVSVNIIKADKMAVKLSNKEEGEGEEHEVMLTIIADDDDEKDVNVNVKVDADGKYMWTTSDEEEGHKVFKIKSGDGNEIVKEGKVIIVKKDGEGEEAVIEILSEDEDLEKVFEVKGNVVVDGHHAVKVIKKGDKDLMFFGDENEGHHGNMAFFSTKPEKKQAIQLKPLENGQFRLEVNTDDTEPVVIEVFNATGDRLYKKKVRHYYGRFLQEVNLSDNESAFFTVKVTQGEREIIGEFEFK